MICQSRALALTAALFLFLTGCGSLAGPAPTATSEATLAPVPTVPALKSSPVPPARVTIALVTDVGGLHDRSFNDLAWAGIREARRMYGVHGTVRQSKTELNYLRALTRSAKKHPSLVVAVGGSMAAAVYAVAIRYPRQKFALVDARPVNRTGRELIMSNVANLLFKEQDSGFMAGVLAGLMELHHVGQARHNVIGYLGAYPVPAVDRYLGGYVAGARRVDRSIKIEGGYAGTYTNRRRGLEMGLDQIHHGADILFQVASRTGTGYIQAAGEKKVYAIGADVDQRYIGSQVIVSAVKRVDVAVRRVAREVELGRFQPGDRLFGAAQGATGLSRPAAIVPRSLFAETQPYAAQLAHGTIQPPTAPPAR